ncbi:MAG: S41 family peptidase [Blastocatellia bacterium]
MDPTEPLTALKQWDEAPRENRCEAIIAQARALLDQACVHLPYMRARGIDPIIRLDQLRSRLPETRSQFYRALLSIFAEIGDRHTQCFLPKPLADKTAFLPFLVKEYFENGRRRLAVAGSGIDDLERGDTLISWNGLPVATALERHMALQLGANTEARLAKAVQTLTFRPLAFLPAPEEDVILESISADGRRRKIRLEWRLAGMPYLVRRFSSIFEVKKEENNFSGEGFHTRIVKTSFGVFGYIRVASFHTHPDVFLKSFIEALETLPEEGLILDLRACEDGIISTAEQLLQLFTPAKIEPQSFQFRMTDLIRQIVNTSHALREWRDTIESPAPFGDRYSRWLPLTSSEKANTVGQKYRGPVVVIVDALTYSSAEMFAAGFQDHRIGRVLGTARRTGGGGASPWQQSTIFSLSGNELFQPLPDAPIFRVAVRRCRRVRRQQNRHLESIGVVPDLLHLPTRNDLLNDDAELLEKAGSMLAEKCDQV